VIFSFFSRICFYGNSTYDCEPGFVPPRLWRGGTKTNSAILAGNAVAFSFASIKALYESFVNFHFRIIFKKSICFNFIL
jgi:hypothetical protein